MRWSEVLAPIASGVPADCVGLELDPSAVPRFALYILMGRVSRDIAGVFVFP